MEVRPRESTATEVLEPALAGSSRRVSQTLGEDMRCTWARWEEVRWRPAVKSLLSGTARETLLAAISPELRSTSKEDQLSAPSRRNMISVLRRSLNVAMTGVDTAGVSARVRTEAKLVSCAKRSSAQGKPGSARRE